MLACSNRQSLRIAWKEHWNWNFQFTFRGWLWLYGLCRISQINTLTSWAIIDYWLVLKNDGVRQLGWLFISFPIYYGKHVWNHQPDWLYHLQEDNLSLSPWWPVLEIPCQSDKILNFPSEMCVEFHPMNFRPGIKQHLTINYRDFYRDYQSSLIRIIASSWNKSWNM